MGEEERKKGERSELAKLRVSLIEAKVAVEKGELAVEALSQKVVLSETTLGKAMEEAADLKEEITNLKEEINNLKKEINHWRELKSGTGSRCVRARLKLKGGDCTKTFSTL